MRQRTRKGATSTEYLFCAALIIAAMLGSVATFGSSTQETMQNNSTQLQQVLDR